MEGWRDLFVKKWGEVALLEVGQGSVAVKRTRR